MDCTLANGTPDDIVRAQSDMLFECSSDNTNWSNCLNLTLNPDSDGIGHDLNFSISSSGTFYMKQYDQTYNNLYLTLTYVICSMNQKPDGGGYFWPALSDDSLYYTDGTNGRNVDFASTDSLTITVYSDTVRIQTNYWMASTICLTIDTTNYSIENNYSDFSHVTEAENDIIEISASSITSSVTYNSITKTMYYTSGYPNFTGDRQTISAISGNLDIVKCEYD